MIQYFKIHDQQTVAATGDGRAGNQVDVLVGGGGVVWVDRGAGLERAELRLQAIRRGVRATQD